MARSESACPTEVLVQLLEDTRKENIDSKNKLLIPRSNFSSAYEDQFVLDMSPFRSEYLTIRDSKTCNKDAEEKEDLKIAGNLNECPVDILVDLPDSGISTPENEECPVDILVDLPDSGISTPENQDSIQKFSERYKKKDFLNESSKNQQSPLDFVNPEFAVARIRWKTPSPQSMSRISKEASRVIDNLKSVSFDEDFSLNKEILPIPINFDFDSEDDLTAIEENIDKSKIYNKNTSIKNKPKPLSENNNDVHFMKENINKIQMYEQKTSVNVQTKPLSENANKFGKDGKDVALIPIHLPAYRSEKTNKSESLGSKSSSLDVHSDSFNSEFTVFDEADEVFSLDGLKLMELDTKDKKFREKIQLGSSEIHLEKSKNFKNIPLSKVKIGFRETSRNVSYNIRKTNDTEARSKISLNSNIKNVATPKTKVCIKSNILQTTSCQKPPKTMSVIKSMNTSKGIFRSNSFHFPSKTEFSGKIKKTSVPSLNKSLSLSLDKSSGKMPPGTLAKQGSIAIPSKRYSISTPLKDVGLKMPLTPALSKKNNFTAKLMPQSLSRLSLSKSWQQPSSSAKLSGSKVTRPPNQHASEMTETSECFFNSSKLKYSVTSKPLEYIAISTSSKKRFCSKLNLPSPFPAEEERKLSRTLFSQSIDSDKS